KLCKIYSLNNFEPQIAETLPKKLNFKSGSAFENLALKIDSIKNDTCGNSTLVLSITLSHASEPEMRHFIRNSWGSKDVYFRTRLRPIFLVGATNNNSLQNEIENEAKTFRDILQINYMDTYRNLTYKIMAGLSWISENCRITPWILKIDHDVMLNPFNLRKFLEKELQSNPSQNVIIGSCYENGTKPLRFEGISRDFYPAYTSGRAYIISRNSVDKLLIASNETPFFSLEDIFITGILAKKAKVQLKNIDWRLLQPKALYFSYWQVYLQ
ncbi:Acetylgalactosaminyl-O-glycosyl-glycoprotein beta-1,3-N-acetylglucosaminyltransferase, partial [Armadillidium vulgare]